MFPAGAPVAVRGPGRRRPSGARGSSGAASGSGRGGAPKSRSRTMGTVSLEISRSVSKTPTPLMATASTQGARRGLRRLLNVSTGMR